MKFISALIISVLPVVASAQNALGTLAHIEETGEFTIGYRTTHPPVSFANAAGLPTGYSVAICDRVAAEVKAALGREDIKVSYAAVGAEDRFDKIEDGTIDLLCGATTKTLSRMERVGFSQLTLVTGGTFLSLDPNRIDKVADLAGQRVAVAGGTTTETSLIVALERAGIEAEIVRTSTAEDGLAALNAGEVSAYAADQIVLVGQVMTQSSGNRNYYLSSNFFSFEPYALALKRGDPDFALLVDRTISRLFGSGQITDVYTEFFSPFGLKPPSTLLTLYRLMSTPE
ncbi:MAG: amino acid ABC transporter substrate-binding protein [Dinoroseobacter sp.]|nr:amino acid ABC transporter substrate-binding protein [Dinoroseobacter sp.]